MIPRGVTISDLALAWRAALVEASYTISQAVYDLRELRGKGLVSKLPPWRRYHAEPRSLRTMAP